MQKNWKDCVVTDVTTAVHVKAGTGIVVCNNRNTHGFVFNDGMSNREYLFANGTVLKTPPHSVFYLPKGSHYRVKTLTDGECFAINFDLAVDPDEPPFVITPKHSTPFLECFKEAIEGFQKSPGECNWLLRKNVYAILDKIIKHTEKNYLPNKKWLLLQPAVEEINRNFTQNTLSVSHLSRLCGISDAYFRRLFAEMFAVSPKEYIINRRIEYAKLLLADNQFPVSQVGELCGYIEPCYFSREFTRRCHMSPNAYKKKQQE